MEILKNFFKDDDKIIGLSGFKHEDEERLNVFIPKLNPSKIIFQTNYEKNFFLM